MGFKTAVSTTVLITSHHLKKTTPADRVARLLTGVNNCSRKSQRISDARGDRVTFDSANFPTEEAEKAKDSAAIASCSRSHH